jgi:hypothetical protein
MEQGWIYVLVNSSMPGMVKVGRTTRQPAERVAELSAATGVATPFILAFEQDFHDCVEAEEAIHAALDARGLRVAANREFFAGPAAEIVRVVLQVAAAAGVAPDPKPVASGAELLAEGDRHLFGQGTSFEDASEALRCYKLASHRGSLVALERMGAVYGQAHGKTSAGRRRAMRYLKDGARRGNYYCYTEMAIFFMTDPHAGNFVKAWDRFFAERAENPCPEVEVGEFRYLEALRRYVCCCINMNLPPAHLAELSAEGERLIGHFVTALEKLRDPEQRVRLAGALRWTYQNLLPVPREFQERQHRRMPGQVRRLETA